MGQLITTIMSLLLLVIVQVGVVQFHLISQIKNELLDISFATATFISNRGGISEADVSQAARDFVKEELKIKSYQLDEKDLTMGISRTFAQEPVLWSHADQFELSMRVPVPFITRVFGRDSDQIYVTRNGTINVMDYDL
ncbi:hypothetical protein [Brevibacillus daliensis]|uniref:hypothetical protein n=1 Tax=Brevibacillus daliensis TaxID=2892995 RepID=UPI001E64A030|nr:hypothetical protein [Brevibacillus daliensis]